MANLHFVAKTRKTSETSLIITIPKTLNLKDGEAYQFSVDSVPLSSD